MRAITYAIGDVHGRLDLLTALLASVEAHAAQRNAAATIIFTGDFMDRGADSFGVVERLIAGPRRAGDRFIPLRGNHDDLFVRAVSNDSGVPDWAWQLYWHTIKSYGLDQAGPWRGDRQLARHAEFLRELPLVHEAGPYLFVHAGIRPGVALADQLDQDLLWIREEFLHHEGLLSHRVVHGHTIVGDKPEMRRHRISIDTGAYRSGVLTAAVLDGTDVTFLQAVGEPDRPALVREAMLSAAIHGHTVSRDLQKSFDAFLAGDIDAPELDRRLQREF